MKFKDIKFKHILLLIAFTVGLIFFFIYIKNIWAALSFVYTVIKPVIYGLVLAYLLNYPFKLFYDHAFKKMGTKHKWVGKIRKPLALLLSYIIVFGVLTYLIIILVPEISASVDTLIENIPSYGKKIKDTSDVVVAFINDHLGYNLYDADTYNQIIKTITGNNTADFIKNIAQTVVPSAFSAVFGVGTGLYNWGIGIILSIYLLASKDRLLLQVRRVIISFTPQKFSIRFFRFAYICNNKCGKYIVGKIIDSLIIGIICFIGLSIFRFNYALLISVIVGVTNVIPFFGPIIGAIPCAFLLLIINPMEALWFVIFIIVLQQFDGNILGPKILGETVGISGFWILVSVIIGGGLFGVPGMLLSVPVFAVIYTLVEEGVKLRESKKALRTRFQSPTDDSMKTSSKEVEEESLQMHNKNV